MVDSQRFDVIVVGAGMVGAAFACLLARANPAVRIALIEVHQSDPFDPHTFDPRVAALTENRARFSRVVVLGRMLRRQG